MTYFKAEIVDKRQYLIDDNGKKKYGTDIIEEAMAYGKKLHSNEILHVAYGETPEEARKAAKCFLAVNAERLQEEGLKLGRTEEGQEETIEGIELKIFE